MATKSQEGAAETVRLLIYSGRPDPEWPVGPDELEALVGLLRRVVGAEEIHPPPAAGLGYRGFLVRGVSVTDRPADFNVLRRVVTERSGTRTRHWRDTAGVEQWLLEQARRLGHGAVLDSEGIEDGKSG
jgi:hypothetical protein